MNNEYSERVQFCDMKNGQLQSTAERMRLSILGRDAKAKDDKPLGVVDAYMKENTTELVDPLDVKKKVEHVGREAEYSAHRTGHADQSVQRNHIYRDSINTLPALRKFLNLVSL